MYCHLCKTEATSNHDRSLGHRAAKELVAAALDRLSNQLSGDSAEGSTNVSTEADSDKVKTPEAVTFCDSCNVVYPINEQASHMRLKKHALALLNEQTFTELVQAYVGDTTVGSASEASDDGAFVDETETEKTYTCDNCALEVPNVFKSDHERGTLHRTNRTLALAAVRSARNMLAPEATSEDKSDDRPKFTGKMMRKLLRIYTGKSDEEQADAEPAPREKEKNRLTAKGYFTDILPFLPYIGSFNTLFIDNTEYITINVGSDYLKIHVNNLNGLNNVDGRDDCLCCRLCDGFSNMYYGSSGEQDKLHVMSLGHIRNVLSPVDNVHLIRKIGDTHAICALCNVHMAVHMIDNHVLKDNRHSTNLSDALERGKHFKETGDHLKIVCYQPNQKPSIFKHNNQWRFGIPQPPSYFGGPFGATASGNTQTGFGCQGQSYGNPKSIFGSAQTAGSGQPMKYNVAVSRQDLFGNANAQTFGTQNASSGLFGVFNNTALNNSNCFGAPQNPTPGFGAPQNPGPGFGAPQNPALGFGAAQNPPPGFGTPQNHTPFFGEPLKNVSIFDPPHNNATGPTISLFSGAQNKAITVDASQNNANGFGAPQKNASISGAPQNNSATFGAPQNNATGFGASQNNANSFGVPQKNLTIFGAPQNNTAYFGAPQNNGTGFGTPQNNATGFGSHQNNATGFGAPPNNATGFSAPPNNAAGIGAPSNNATGFGAPQNNATGFSAPPNNATGFGAPPNNATGIGAPPNNATPFGTPQNNATPFGSSENTESGFGAQNISPGGFDQNNTTTFGGVSNKTSSTELTLGYGLRSNASSNTSQSKDTGSGGDQTKTKPGDQSVLKIKEVIDKSKSRKRIKTPPQRYYSSSSDDE